MPTPQELAYTKAAQAVNSIIAAGNQPDTATLANLAKAKKALATIGKDPTKAGGVATALTQNDEEAEEFVFGTKVQAVGPRGQKWSGIVVDPVDIIDSEENGEIDTGGAASDALAQDLTLIQTDDGEYHAVPSSIVKVISRNGEDNEWDDEERHGDANGRWSDKRTGRSHRDDQGDDEDAESKPEPHAWSPSCDCPKCQAAYAKENERRRKTGLSHESTQINNFIKAISQKNYASANKYLQGVVDSKLKRSISKAANK